MLEQLLNLVMQSRRLIIYGGAGVGKSNLARHLTRYLALKLRLTKEDVIDVQLSTDSSDGGQQVSKLQLEILYRELPCSAAVNRWRGRNSPGSHARQWLCSSGSHAPPAAKAISRCPATAISAAAIVMLSL